MLFKFVGKHQASNKGDAEETIQLKGSENAVLEGTQIFVLLLLRDMLLVHSFNIAL